MLNTAITLKDLSSLSGFSVSTVSKALNNKVDISPETKEAIQCIAKEHRYIPNNYAVALRKKKSKAIAVIIPQLDSEFYSSILSKIQKSAYQLGYRILFFQSFSDNDIEANYLTNINDGSVDGAIVMSSNNVNSNQCNNTVLPIEFIHLSNTKDIEKQKSYCINRFHKLLKKM